MSPVVFAYINVLMDKMHIQTESRRIMKQEDNEAAIGLLVVYVHCWLSLSISFPATKSKPIKFAVNSHDNQSMNSHVFGDLPDLIKMST